MDRERGREEEREDYVVRSPSSQHSQPIRGSHFKFSVMCVAG